MIAIKFRGIRLNGEWAYGLLAISQGYPGQPEAGCYISNSCGMPWAYSVRPETVGQYVGLKDKNGKEIYRGDIDKVFGNIIMVYGCFIGRAFVLSEEDEKEKNDTILGDTSQNQREIIGNIHENPELM